MLKTSFIVVLCVGFAACVGAGPQISITRGDGIPSGEPGGTPSGEPGTIPTLPIPMQFMGSGGTRYQSENYRGYGGNSSTFGGTSKSSLYEMKSPVTIIGQQEGANP